MIKQITQKLIGKHLQRIEENIQIKLTYLKYTSHLLHIMNICYNIKSFQL